MMNEYTSMKSIHLFWIDFQSEQIKKNLPLG